VLDRVLRTLVPPVCLACRAPGADLCAACRRALPWLDGPVCPRCALPAPCGPHCPASQAAFEAAWAAVVYAGPARRLVLALKASGRHAAAGLMAAQIAAGVPAALLAGAVLVPVPGDPGRSRRRGFDQSERLADALARRTGLSVSRCLARTAGRRQVGAGRAERLAGGRLEIACRAPAPARALLVDDVHTTGATLSTCAAGLRRAGSLWVGAVTYARTC
jgi:predicted amidophosphoribosyltransferase